MSHPHPFCVGAAPLVYTRHEVDQYAARVDGLMDVFDQDVQAQVASGDPTQTPDALNAAADKLDADIKQLPDWAAAPLKLQSASLRAKAKAQASATAGKTSAQLDKEHQFSNDWSAFYGQWKTFYKALTDPVVLFNYSGSWDKVEAAETSLRGYRSTMRTVLGLAPASPEPPTEAQIKGEHQPPPADMSWVKYVAGAAALGAAAWAYANFKK